MTQHQGACSREGSGGFPPGTAAVSKHETSTVTKQTTGALQFMATFALRGGQLLREYISLRCALGGGRPVPAKTSKPLANTSEHDTPLLCQARDNPDVSKKGQIAESKHETHAESNQQTHTAVIKARGTCCVKARDTLAIGSVPNTAVKTI